MYVIKKKDSPYYVKSVDDSVSYAIEISYLTAKFTDVPEFIELKFKLKRDALQMASTLNHDTKYTKVKFEVVKL